jgi:hypothetical protein
LNYYNYFTEIEDTFIRRRGKHLLLSPIDWAMMETWQERGIPLHIVLRGIESVFDHFDKNPRPRTIKSLLFCREEIEAQFAEWATSQIGKTDAAHTVDEDNPLSLSVIDEHITSVIDNLQRVAAESLTEDITRAVTRLTELKANVAADPEQTDRSLSDVENFLDQALLSKTEKPHLKQIEKDVAGQMRAYKADMEKDAYDKTFRLMLLKRLREDLGIPRMSLFYL